MRGYLKPKKKEPPIWGQGSKKVGGMFEDIYNED
jgi:hypothetical protein